LPPANNERMDDHGLRCMVEETRHCVREPVGVADGARARDEYCGYVPATFRLLQEGAAVEAIAAYLDNVAVDGMGLSPNSQHAPKDARLLIKWRD